MSTVDVDEGVCSRCHVVVEPTPVCRERRPIYTHEDWQTKARCGGRSTFLRSDDGLGAGVSWEPHDWERSKSSEAYRLDYAFGEIRRMSSALELPRPEREEAGRLYRACYRQELVIGRSIDGFATACLLAAIRNSGRCPPVLTSELESVSRAERSQIRTARGAISCYLDGVSIPPLRPEELAPRVASELDASAQIRRTAGAVVRAYSTGNHGHSLSPATVVGAAFHLAYHVVGISDRPSLSAVSAAVDVAPSTISKRKTTLRECFEDQVPEADPPTRGQLSSN